MTNSAWPPEKGFPAKPEEEGWHWLQHRTNDTPAPYHWREEDCTGEWRWGGGMHEAIIKKEVVYRGSIQRPAKECGRLIEARFQEGNEKDAQ